MTVLASALVGAAAARAGVGSWLTTGSMLTGRHPRAAITLADGRVLAIYAAGDTDASELFSPATGNWAAGPETPAPASVGSATPVALAGGGALLAGGADCDAFHCVPSADSYRLSPGDSAWLPTAPMLQPRALPTVVALPDGRALVAGGFGDACERPEGYSCAPLASAEVYDPDTNSWTAIEPLPSRAGRAAATVLSDGTVMLVGDAENGREAAWRYDTSSGAWTTIAPPSSAGSALLALPADRVLALGSPPEPGFFGFVGFAGVIATRAYRSCETHAEIYSATTNSWTPAPPLPLEPSCSTAAAAVSGGQVLYLDAGSAFVLDAGQRCWTQTAAPIPSNLQEVAPLADGRALAFGGSLAGEQPLTAAAIYTAASSTCSAAQLLKTSVFSQLLPTGPGARIFPILEHGYPLAFDAIRPGRLAIDWYATRRGLDIPGKGAAPLAVGSAHATRAGIVKLTIRLTPKGVELFENSATVQLVAVARFATAPDRSTFARHGFSLLRYPDGPGQARAAGVS